MQGEWKVEELDRGKQQIVVTSIPYGVDKGELEDAIGGIIEDEEAAAAARPDRTRSNEKDGLRIVLEMKPGTDPNLVMAYLYKHTELQKNFAYNMTCLVPGAGRQDAGAAGRPEPQGDAPALPRLPLRDRAAALRVRAASNCASAFTSSKASASSSTPSTRRSSSSARAAARPDAAEKLMKAFKLDEEQADAILDVAALQDRPDGDQEDPRRAAGEEEARPSEIEAILASKQKLWGVVKDELEALAEKFGDRRKTRMASDEDVLEFDEEAYIVRENTNVVLTRDGWIKRVGRLASVESTRVREGRRGHRRGARQHARPRRSSSPTTAPRTRCG